MKRALLAPLLFVLLATAGCEQVDRLKRAVTPRGDLEAALEAEAPRSEIAAVRAFYSSRDYAPLWVNDDGLAPEGDSLLQRLCTAASEGLRPEDYDFSRLDAAQERLAGGNKDSSAAAALAALDVALSEAYLTYASDLSRGRVPLDSLGGIWRLQRADSLDGRATLDRVAEIGLQASVDSLFGEHSGYSNLRSALSRYRGIYARGGWGTVSGARDRAGLSRRLRATGDLTDSTDAGLSAAVLRFKQRNGLDSTATVDKKTLDALNVPVEQRIAQIEVNLERLRWMPADRGETYLRVNIPTYGLEVYDGGRRIMAMPVIVGDEANNTPVFNDTMTTVVFAPYWNVPQSIQEEELLPKGDAYLARNNFEREGPTGLRQKPGDDNALGHVKFLFPNDLNIYLHDTPGRAAFDRNNRSLSHGCIRVSRPAELAMWVLGPNGSEWDKARVDSAMAGTEERQIPLKRRIPVYLEYMTAWADDDGTVHFREDIYGHDAKLAAQIIRTRRQTAGATCTRRLETAPGAPSAPAPADSTATTRPASMTSQAPAQPRTRVSRGRTLITTLALMAHFLSHPREGGDPDWFSDGPGSPPSRG